MSRTHTLLRTAQVLLVGAFLCCSQVQAATPAIGGYSPVSYFTKNKAELGSEKFQAEYKDQTYYLTSPEQVALFNGNPAHYVPHYGAFCAFSLTEGKKMAIDPTNFKVVGSMLLLFHKSAELDGRSKWNQSGDQQALLKKADAGFKLLEF